MSTYPGNASLASAVKDRVVSTFEQTLALYQQGRTDEVIAGCNLILQMDPLFDPARKLLDKAQVSSTPVDFSTFSTGSDDRLAEARQAAAARDFERVVQITTEILTSDLMNDEARVLSDEAREKIEAAPFVDQFVRKCEQYIHSGNVAAAKSDLEKARALDGQHPGIAQMEAMIQRAESPQPAAGAGFDASSFVVETPASSRGTAQASDFGFTFEEEKTASPAGFDSFSFAETPAAEAAPPASDGGFSFDSPVDTPAASTPAFNLPPPTKEGTEFDFSTGAIETSPDDQKKIEQYLADGDRAFSAADYQQAIDLWSRVFLIDVTNEAASERIEKAKIKRREIEHRLESVLAAGILAFEKKDFVAAKAKFEEVLQGDPSNADAQEYLAQIAQPAAAAAMPSAAASSLSTFDDDFNEAPVRPATEQARPAAALPKKAATPKVAPRTARKKPPVVAMAAAVGIIVVGLAIWFGMSRLGGEPEQSTATTQALVTRASALGAQGKFDEAIAILKDVQPGDGQYDTALAMMADLQQKKARAATAVEGKPAAAFFDENVAAGRAAFAAHDYVGAKTAFENAMRVRPLPADARSSYDTASQQVAKLATARALFNERRYSDVITSLQPLLVQDPRNQNIQRMITDARFNLGAQALQQDRLADAIREFDQVLKEEPNDELAQRSKELAQRYEGQPRDLLYRIYVKYLPLRKSAG